MENYYKSAYSFQLPDHLIAQKPIEPREASRMMHLRAENDSLEHLHFQDFPDLLDKNSLLVVNNTRVIPARLLGQRKTGAALEVLLVREMEPGTWRCKVKNLKKIKQGEKIDLCDGKLEATLREVEEEGTGILEFSPREQLFAILEKHAHAPIPPYIHKTREKGQISREQDLQNYQTTFAKEYGAIAAPTAGLHFTPQIMEKIRAKGIEVCEVTLHVGLGTFEPLRVEDVREHPMHHETSYISPESAAAINRAKQEARKIIAVGTTSVRTLESSVENGVLQAGKRETNLFIYPPYQFQMVDQILTNFHLPESTLLMLISAFAGKDRVLSAYQTAIEKEYRFFSYGDCMFLE